MKTMEEEKASEMTPAVKDQKEKEAVETPEKADKQEAAEKKEASESQEAEETPEKADKQEAAEKKEASESQEAVETPEKAGKQEAAEKKEVSESQEAEEMPEKADKQEAANVEKKSTGELEESKPEAAAPTSEDEPDHPVKKRGAGKIVFLGVLLLLLGLTAGYCGAVVYYRHHFFPNTSINGISCGNMEISEVVPLIDAQLKDYSLTVTGRDYRTGKSGVLLGEIRAEDVALSYVDTTGAIADVFEQQNALLWPRAYFGNSYYAYSLVQGVKFDSEQLRSTVGAWDACREKNMIEPEDAYISEYQEEINGYEVVPETQGTKLDMDSVFRHLENSLYAHDLSLDLEEMQCYTVPGRDQTDRKLTEAVETANKWLETKIIYDWNDNEVILDSALLKDWVTIDQEEPVLDEDAVRKFVKEQAGKYDTYGKRKNFVTALGITLKLRSPNYGWKTNVDKETEELVQLIREGGRTEREPVYSVKASQKGVNDIGSSYVEADLTHQHLYVYQNGEVALETDFVSGKMNPPPGNMTPEGIYGLTYKTTKAVLRGADYESPVDYWMPFYGNYGMHDAQWRRDFGGTIYLDHGSHGCINLPLGAAAVIYNYVYAGSPVICYYYEVDPLGPSEPTTLTEEELRSQEEPTLSQQTEQAEQTQQTEQTQ